MKEFLQLGFLAFVIESNQLTRNIANILVADAGIAAVRAAEIAGDIVTGLMNRLRGFAICWWLAITLFVIGATVEVFSGPVISADELEKGFSLAGLFYVASSISLTVGLFFVLLILTFFVVPARQDLEISHTAWEKTARAFHKLRRNIYVWVYVMLFLALFLSLKPLLPGIPIYIMLPGALLFAMFFSFPVVLDRESNLGARALLLLAFLLLASIFSSYTVKEVKDLLRKHVYPHVAEQKDRDLHDRGNAALAKVEQAAQLDTVRRNTALYDCPDFDPLQIEEAFCHQDKSCQSATGCTKSNQSLLSGEEILLNPGKMIYYREDADGSRLVWVKSLNRDPEIKGFVTALDVQSLYQSFTKPKDLKTALSLPSTQIRYLKRGETATFVLTDLLPYHSLVNGFGTWTVTADRPTLCWSWSTEEGKKWVRADKFYAHYPFAVRGNPKTGTWVFKAEDSLICPLPVTLHFTCNQDCLGGR